MGKSVVGAAVATFIWCAGIAPVAQSAAGPDAGRCPVTMTSWAGDRANPTKHGAPAAERNQPVRAGSGSGPASPTIRPTRSAASPSGNVASTRALPTAGSSTIVPLVVGAVATATGVALLLVRRRSQRR